MFDIFKKLITVFKKNKFMPSYNLEKITEEEFLKHYKAIENGEILKLYLFARPYYNEIKQICGFYYMVYKKIKQNSCDCELEFYKQGPFIYFNVKKNRFYETDTYLFPTKKDFEP